MRKIHSSESKSRKQKTNRLIVGIAMIGLMVLSTLGYAFSGGSDPEEDSIEKIEYNGFSFIKYGSAWVSEGEPKVFLSNNPENISTKFFGVNKIGSYSNKPLYIQFNESLSTFFIYDNFNPFIQRMQQACLGKECGEDFPIKDCENNFIIIEISDKKEILQQDNCVFIKGNLEEMDKLVDSFILEVFEIK